MAAAFLARLDVLIRRGREIEQQVTAHPANPHIEALTSAWQRESAAIVNELSGGTKAHWLARAYSDAFLLRDARGAARGDAPLAGIVARIVRVLEQAGASLEGVRAEEASPADQQPSPRRFEFVRDAALRPLLEAAYLDSRLALADGRFGDALMTSCSLLEAIVTDALSGREPGTLVAQGAPEDPVTTWPFETRLAVAERAGLIRGGCARLPTAARRYRETGAAGGSPTDQAVSEREARLTGQVLRVVMRDLDPGR